MSTDERYGYDRHYDRSTTAAGVRDENSEQIQRRIDRTRGAMDETLDALGEKLSPRRWLDQTIESLTGAHARSGAKSAANSVGGAAADFAQSLGRQVRRNPAATILIGAGLAWMAMSDRNDDDFDAYDDAYDVDNDVDNELTAGRRAARGRYSVDAEGYEWAGADDNTQVTQAEVGYVSSKSEHDRPNGSSKVAQTASKAGEKASELAGSAKSSVYSAAEKAKHAVTSASHSVADTARGGYEGTRRAAGSAYRGTAAGGKSLGRSTRRAYRSGSHAVADAYDETAERLQQAHEDYPLALGLGVLALGALAGLAIPRTRREDEWMGEASDHVKQQTWEAGEDLVEQGKQVAGAAAETAQHSAEEHGLTGQQLAEKTKHVASEAARSAQSTAKEEGLTAKQLKDDVKEVARDTKDAAKQEAKQSPAATQAKTKQS